MVLGEKHGTNYLPYTKYMCREEKFMLYIILLFVFVVVYLMMLMRRQKEKMSEIKIQID